MSWAAFAMYRARGIGWVRIFGYGLSWKNTHQHGLSFSERNGYANHLRIGRWSVIVLRP